METVLRLAQNGLFGGLLSLAAAIFAHAIPIAAVGFYEAGLIICVALLLRPFDTLLYQPSLGRPD